MSATFNRLGHQHIFVFDTTPLLKEQGISIKQRNFMPAVAAVSLEKNLPMHRSAPSSNQDRPALSLSFLLSLHS
jgi:hypothetical protein